MADARALAKVEEESENATEEPTNSLLFVNAKNQFKWNGSVELLLTSNIWFVSRRRDKV